MKFAASILLGLLAVSAAQGAVDWEKKAKDLETKFEQVVDDKANTVIRKITNTVFNTQDAAKDFVEELKREINATITAALKEIEVLKLDSTVECYKNATEDIYQAQQAAINNLLNCQGLSVAYQDIQNIAENASVVAMDVIKDATIIVQGVAECGSLSGFEKWECVFKYATAEIQQLVSQWPDAKQFIAVVKALGKDAENQINACVEDPTQQSLDEKIQAAVNELTACVQA